HRALSEHKTLSISWSHYLLILDKMHVINKWLKVGLYNQFISVIPVLLVKFVVLLLQCAENDFLFLNMYWLINYLSFNKI
ncbi:hypothetical protein, partial [Escherichia coli]|uniref:hypothetical protein n=1 Tax=Escherichia coli TaxID=562 RepID=UPI001950F1F7